LIKLTLDEIPPLTFAGLRYFSATLILLPVIFIKHRTQLLSLSGADWLGLAVLGVIYYFLTQGGQFLTLSYLDATPFSLLLNFTTVLTALSGILFLKEFPSSHQWIGIGIFLVGVLLYFLPFQGRSEMVLGYVFAGVTVFANAIATILGRSVNRKRRISPAIVTVISMGIGSILLLGAGLSVEELPQLSFKSMLVVAWLSVVNTAFAFTLWNRTLQDLTAVESSVINNTMLIQIAFLSWAFLGERLGLIDLIGLLIAAIGIVMVNLKTPKQVRN
jgi:drug/metabolite transporter (DMT)-like permease